MILQYLQVKTENGILLIKIHSSILVICGRKNRVNTFKSQKPKKIITLKQFSFYLTLPFLFSEIFSCLLNSLYLLECTPESELRLSSRLPKQLCYFLIESPLKMMRNTFYFFVKAVFVLEIFKFLS